MPDGRVVRASRLPWFYGWNVLAAGLLSTALVVGIIVSSFTFFVVSWMEDFDSSRTEAMVVLAVSQLVAGFMYPFAGRVMDRHAINRVGALGLLCLAGGLALASFATALWQLMAIYGVLLAGASALAGLLFGQTLAARWFRRRRGFAIGLASMGASLGGLLLPPLVAALLEEIGWRPTFLALAGIVLLIGVPTVSLVVANSPQDKGVEPEPEGRQPSPAGTSEWTTVTILREPVFWFLVLGFLSMLFVSTGLMTNIAPYALDRGIDARRAALLLSLWSLTMIAGKVLFGVLADRFDHRLLYFVGLGFFAVGCVMLASEPDYLMMFFVVFLMGFAGGAQAPLMGVMIGSYFGPLAFASVMGLYMLCIRPVALAAPVAAWVRDSFGSYDGFWLGGLALTLVFAPLIVRVRARAPKLA